MGSGRTLGLILLLATLGVAPASQPSGVTVSGRVAAPNGLPADVIVYLEPADPSVRVDPPTEIAEVSQKGARFSPPLLVVSVGQQVDFKNDEDRPIEHNVFSRSPAQQFDLGLYKPPEGKKVTFTTPGVVRLYCSIHRLMDGMVYVCPTRFWARVQSNGTYRIAGVPPGQWKLRTWQKQAKYDEQDVPLKVESSDVVLDLQMSRK